MGADNRGPFLLTIGVPTYNRCAALKSLLEMIEREVPKGAPVEVLVSDNASPDETERVVQDFARASPLKCAYNRNAANVGFDGNILSVYQKAHGQYVWFLADDDYIEPGGVKHLLDALEGADGACGVVINNVRNGLQDGDWADLVPYAQTGIRMRAAVGRRARVEGERERLTVVLTASQVSTCVVRRYDEPFPEGPGGGHMHERLANLSLLRVPFYLITDKPVVRGGPSWWTRWFMDAVMFGIRELYGAPDMMLSQELQDVVTTQTCKLGLRLLACRHRRKIEVSYPEPDSGFICRLKAAYGDAYAMLEPDVLKAVQAAKHKKRDRLLFLLSSPFFFAFKVFEIVIRPRLQFWASLLRCKMRPAGTRSQP